LVVWIETGMEEGKFNLLSQYMEGAPLVSHLDLLLRKGEPAAKYVRDVLCSSE